jgi:hypothetical protein
MDCCRQFEPTEETHGLQGRLGGILSQIQNALSPAGPRCPKIVHGVCDQGSLILCLGQLMHTPAGTRNLKKKERSQWQP